MITNIQEKSDRSFESISFLNAYIKRLEREIELAQSELTQVTSVNFYTKEIKKKKSKLEADIAYKSNLIAEIKDMQQFPPGSWVKNGSVKPGKVVELRVVGSVPEVQVQWWGATVPVPERACNLTLVDDYQLEYIWNGDRIPKLIRRLDSYECEDVEIIDLKLNEAAYERTNVKPSDAEFLEEVNRRLAYCKKRIKYLSEPKRDRVSIAAIKRELCTQQRVKLNHETVVEYAEAMKDGDKFPPVKLTYDGTNYWLTDGFHTTEAAWSIGQKFIEAEVTRGTQRDAILASVAVNALHGLRRTNADKRKAVTTLLEDDEWKLWSDREIARRCKVSNVFVSKLRKDISPRLNEVTKLKNESDLTVNINSDNHRNYIDKYGNVSTMQTENIGVKVERDNNGIEPRWM